MSFPNIILIIDCKTIIIFHIHKVDFKGSNRMESVKYRNINSFLSKITVFQTNVVSPLFKILRFNFYKCFKSFQSPKFHHSTKESKAFN